MRRYPIQAMLLSSLVTVVIACSAPLAPALYGQDLKPSTVPLWPDGAPGALGNQDQDIPKAIVYLPASEEPTGAVVVCPGGGYGALAMGHEGHDIARWLNSLGLAAVIVDYRHRGKGYGHPAPLQDAQRAIRLTRARKDEWRIDPLKVGVMGFSAGGHLASTVSTHFDAGEANAADPVSRESCRPDFSILCYPVIALDESFTHRGSKRNLLGDSPDPALIKLLSNQRQITASTPPAFLWHTAEDRVVPVQNSLAYCMALADAGVFGEIHVFPEGRHGLGLARQQAGAKAWPKLCETWLRELAVLP